MRATISRFLAVTSLLIPGGAAGAQEVSSKEITAALNSPDSHLRNNTWKKLNPNDDGDYKTLVQILRTLSWHDRDGAVIAFAKATPDTCKKMVRDLKDHKDPLVRQGMALALAKTNDEQYYPALYAALKDKDPVVRRMVVHSLRVHKKNEAVSAVVDAFQKEEDPVVRSFMVNTLNDLTKAYQGPDPRAWFTWWEQAKADKDYELGKIDEESQRKAEELGHKLKKRQTVSMAGGVTLETEERGSSDVRGVPILVLPEYGRSTELMKPFLSELEKTNKLIYVPLPHISKFKNLPAVSAKNIPYYPIDKLVSAFEDYRKENKQERFALIACGLNCWIAMRYASLYPGSVSHLVLVCPVSSLKAYGDGLDRMEREGKAKNDIELWHYALSQRFNQQTGEDVHDLFHKEKKIPMPEGEGASLDRRRWSTYFKDHRDTLASILYPISRDRESGGDVAIPDFKCFSEPKRNIPTIVIVGAGSLFASVQDCQAIAKHYGGVFYVYPNSSAMPFAEESATFNKHMALLLREKVKGASAKKKEKDKDKEKEKEAAKGSTAVKKDAEEKKEGEKQEEAK